MFLISGTPSKLTLHCLLDFCGMRPDCNCRYGDSAVFIIEDSNINGQLVSGVCSGMGMAQSGGLVSPKGVVEGCGKETLKIPTSVT